MNETMRRVLRCVPDAGSGETAAPREIAGRTNMAPAVVHQTLVRAQRLGLVVRVRPGAYCLAAPTAGVRL